MQTQSTSTLFDGQRAFAHFSPRLLGCKSTSAKNVSCNSQTRGSLKQQAAMSIAHLPTSSRYWAIFEHSRALWSRGAMLIANMMKRFWTSDGSCKWDRET